MTKVLGLTGGIGSGKTTISNYFRELNIPVIDADIIARQVMQAGEPAVQKIAATFGSEVLLENSEINRPALSQLIFTSEEKRETLNNIVQPSIRQAILKAIERKQQGNPSLIVLDIPLLYEQNYEKEVDEVMVVYVDEEIQKERLLKRDHHLTEEDVINRIYSQMPLSKKANQADVVIDNNGTLDESIKQVTTWLQASFGSGSI